MKDGPLQRGQSAGLEPVWDIIERQPLHHSSRPQAFCYLRQAGHVFTRVRLFVSRIQQKTLEWRSGVNPGTGLLSKHFYSLSRESGSKHQEDVDWFK